MSRVNKRKGYFEIVSDFKTMSGTNPSEMVKSIDIFDHKGLNVCVMYDQTTIDRWHKFNELLAIYHLTIDVYTSFELINDTVVLDDRKYSKEYDAYFLFRDIYPDKELCLRTHIKCRSEESFLQLKLKLG